MWIVNQIIPLFILNIVHVVRNITIMSVYHKSRSAYDEKNSLSMKTVHPDNCIFKYYAEHSPREKPCSFWPASSDF